MRPRISVVIPAYNAASTIGTCVESVKRQRYPDMEIIVVDDGSGDDTAEIAQGMPGVTTIVQGNAGPAGARNKAIGIATGEWLAFLDADEEWLGEDRLSGQLDCAARNGAVLVGAERRRGSERKVSFRRLLLGNPFRTSTVLALRRAVLDAGSFEEGRCYSEDYMLWLEIVARGGAACLADVPGSRDIAGRARFSEGGLSGNLRAMQRGEELNYLTLARKGLLGKTAVESAFWLACALAYSRAKYAARIATRAGRKLRNRG
jgi:glycosyltransferase involved in cell wall biosynthesis